MSATTKRIALDRRVCVVREGRIDVKPERAAVLGPLIGLSISVALFAAIAVLGSRLSVGLLAAMLLPGLILGPLSGMGLVYSLFGAHVVIDARKQSAGFQQGILGLGIGTVELVPFWKIERLEVRDYPLGDTPAQGPPPPLDLRAWDIVLVKTSGKELSIGQVVAANTPDLIDEGFDRILDVAESVSTLVDKPLEITAAVEERVEETATQSETRPAEGALRQAQDERAEGSQA